MPYVAVVMSTGPIDIITRDDDDLCECGYAYLPEELISPDAVEETLIHLHREHFLGYIPTQMSS